MSPTSLSRFAFSTSLPLSLSSPCLHPSITPTRPPKMQTAPPRHSQLEQTYRLAKAAYKEAKSLRKQTVHVISNQCEAAEKKREDAYRMAKDAYKEAKAKRKAEDLTALRNGSSLLAEADVEERYRVAKTAYKEAKAAYKQGRKIEENVKMMDITGAVGNGKECVQGGILVCGGKACTKLGATAVVEVLRKGKGGPVEVGEKCMGKCGGVGPTVRVAGGEVMKVDFRAAVMKVLDGVEI